MRDLHGIDWGADTAEDHLAAVKAAEPAMLCAVVRRYDWGCHPETVLGWAMAQQCIDLGTALRAFLNGDPGRFNYLAKREIPESFTGICRLLDNICLRVNSGFYLAVPDAPLETADHRQLRRWLDHQTEDRARGTGGRWVLDEMIVTPLLDGTAQGKPAGKPLSRSQQDRPRGADVFPELD
jgi:hypothetical protein